MSDAQVEVLEAVSWYVDDDGTHYFEHEGRRYELAADGYAYDAGPAAGVAPPSKRRERVDVGSVPPPDAAAATHGAGRAGVGVATGSEEPAAGAAGLGPDESEAGPLLRVEGLRAGYGRLPVLHGVDLAVEHGETAVLLGLNGAGKTTTATAICGVLGAWSGRIELAGRDITGWSVRRCVDAGVVMVPEGRRVFADLTVERNLQLGAWRHRKDAEWVVAQLDRVLDYFPRLRERRSQRAGTLSGGEQQMLAIARGLMARPRLLIIDEASMGLAPVIVSQVYEIVEQINADGVTVLMIEQNVAALDVADVALVMEQGRILRELRGAQLQDRGLVSQTLMS